MARFCTIRYRKWMTDERCLSSSSAKLASSPSLTRSINCASASRAIEAPMSSLTRRSIKGCGLFRFEAALHEPSYSFARRAALVQHGVHLLGDGHFDPMAMGQIDRGVGGLDAFGHHLHGADDLVQFLAEG